MNKILTRFINYEFVAKFERYTTVLTHAQARLIFLKGNYLGHSKIRAKFYLIGAD